MRSGGESWISEEDEGEDGKVDMAVVSGEKSG